MFTSNEAKPKVVGVGNPDVVFKRFQPSISCAKRTILGWTTLSLCLVALAATVVLTSTNSAIKNLNGVISVANTRTSSTFTEKSTAKTAESSIGKNVFERSEFQLPYAHDRPNYPEYCSKPEEIEHRVIPPAPDNLGISTQLLQVFSIFRHGAHTPTNSDLCWEDYSTLSQGFDWQCRLGSLQAPSMGMPDGLFAFGRKYDAIPSTNNHKSDWTCLNGRLLDEAYGQMFTTGRHLREAYVTTKFDEMMLFASPMFEDRPYEESLYFRSLDEPRALLSGQILVNGLFEVSSDTIMDVHTAYFSMDVLKANEKECPRLTDLRHKTRDGEEYKVAEDADDKRVLRNVVREELKPSKNDIDMIDCLMTSYCNDRDLPPILSDFVSDGDDSLFTQMFEYFAWKDTYYFLPYDAEYSKLAMGPFWADITESLQRTEHAYTLDDMARLKQPRIHLVSSTADTLISVLASLGNGVWNEQLPPYASNVVIENHVLTSAGTHPDFPSGRAFRLIWDGRVITDRIVGCDFDLCDLGILLDVVKPFATRERDCGAD